MQVADEHRVVASRVEERAARQIMNRTIRPGLPAYLPLGAVVAGVIAVWVGVWVARGPQTGAWQPILLLTVIYLAWIVFVSARVLTLTDAGLTCSYRIGRSRTIEWSDIGTSAVTYWMKRVPTQILVYGRSFTKPVLTIPLGLYRRSDVEYLMGLEEMKIDA